jgi:hypothetical protein
MRGCFPGLRFRLRALRFGGPQTRRSSRGERRRVAPSGLRRLLRPWRMNQQRSAGFYNGAADRQTSRRRNQQRSASAGTAAPWTPGAARKRLQAVCKRSKLARRRHASGAIPFCSRRRCLSRLVPVPSPAPCAALHQFARGAFLQSLQWLACFPAAACRAAVRHRACIFVVVNNPSRIHVAPHASRSRDIILYFPLWHAHISPVSRASRGAWFGPAAPHWRECDR